MTRAFVIVLLASACVPPFATVHPSVHPELASITIRAITAAPVDLVIHAEAEGIVTTAAAKLAFEHATPLLDEAIHRTLRKRGYRAMATTIADYAKSRDRVLEFNQALLVGGVELPADRKLIDGDERALPGEATLYVGGHAYLQGDHSYRRDAAVEVVKWVATGEARQPANPDAHNELCMSATLIENRTGRVLWAAALPSDVDPVDRYEVRKFVAHLLELLPAPKLPALALDVRSQARGRAKPIPRR